MKAADDKSGIPDPCEPELESLDALTARTFHAMGRVMRLNRLVMSRVFAHRGIQHAEILALTLLGRHEGLTQRELGEVLHLSPSRVSMVLSSLEETGDVVRRPDETDRRLSRVFLTPEGRHRESEQRAFLADHVKRTLGTLSEDDKLEFERLLNELADRTLDVLSEHEAAEDGEEERGG